MKLLITGGAGFIGANFIDYIVSHYPSYSIVNLDSMTYAASPEHILRHQMFDQYTFIQGDITDETLVRKAMAGCDAIVHFAAESHVDNSIESPYIFTKTNVLGTHVLLEVARQLGHIRFHHVSTDEVFGSLELESQEMFHENSLIQARSPYSASKAASDQLALSYYHTYHLPVTITNCSNNYGPYQHPEKFIPLFITNLLEDKKVPLYGDGKNVRDWIHVMDHCKAIDLVLHHGQLGSRYCIGGNCERSNIQMTKSIVHACKKDESYIDYVSDRKGHDRRYAIDSSKIQKELGFKPMYLIDEALPSLIQWYKENEAFWKPLKQKRV